MFQVELSVTDYDAGAKALGTNKATSHKTHQSADNEQPSYAVAIEP